MLVSFPESASIPFRSVWLSRSTNRTKLLLVYVGHSTANSAPEHLHFVTQLIGRFICLDGLEDFQPCDSLEYLEHLLSEQ